MKAIILAAGKGVRMRPLTLQKPKPLLEVGGKPLLEHIVSRFPEEVDELIIVVGYLAHKIKDHCKEEFLGKKVNYVVQEKKLGTFHALKLCRPYLQKEERFFVFYADDIHGDEGIRNCLDHERALIVEEAEDPRKFGVVKINPDMSISEIIEKPENPSSNLVSTGVLLLDTKVFDYEAEQHPNGEFYLTDALSKMLKSHKIYAVRSTLWLPVGYPEDIKKAERKLKKI